MEANKASSKNNNISMPDNRYFLSEIHKFGGVVPPALWQKYDKAMFRISTSHTLTKAKKYVVIAVSEDLKSIEEDWNNMIKLIAVNMKCAGFTAQNITTPQYNQEFLQFLLIHISALYYIHNKVKSITSEPSSSNSNEVVTKSEGGGGGGALSSPRSPHEPFEKIRKQRCRSHKLALEKSKDDEELVAEKTLSLSNQEARKRRPRSRTEKSSSSSSSSRKSMPFLFGLKGDPNALSEEEFEALNLDEVMIAVCHCFIVTPISSVSSLQSSREYQKHTIIAGFLFLTEKHLCFSSLPPNQLTLKFPLVSVENVEVMERFENFKALLTFKYFRREFRFIGVKNVIEFIDEILNIRSRLLSHQLRELQERLQSTSSFLNSAFELSILRRLLRKRQPPISANRTPIFDYPLFILSQANENSVPVSVIINDGPNIQGTLYIDHYLSIFKNAEHHILVAFIYKNIGNIIENNQFFEVVIEMHEISSQFILKFPSAQSFLLFIDKWSLIKNEEAEFNQSGFILTEKKYESKQEFLLKLLPEESFFHLTLWDRFFSMHGFDTIRTNLLLYMIRSGVPNHLRGEIWKITSGVWFKQCNRSGEVPYEYLLELHRNEDSLATSEILRDIDRSLPEHSYYQTEDGLNSLKRVLIAFSWRNTEIGYCQSMNVIAALLLLYMSEQDTYHFLCVICEELLPNYYNRSMEGSLIDQQVLRSLLERYLPAVYSHFSTLEVPIVVITLPWFLCIYIRIIPWPAALRVLDIFLALGRKVLFQMALAIFKMFEKQILETRESIEIILLMKSLLDSVDANLLLQIAVEQFGDIQNIDELYHTHRPQILKEIRQNQLLDRNHQSKKYYTSDSSLHVDDNPPRKLIKSRSDPPVAQTPIKPKFYSHLVNTSSANKNNNNNNQLRHSNGETSNQLNVDNHSDKNGIIHEEKEESEKESVFWLIKESFQLRQTNADIKKVLEGIGNTQKKQNSSLIHHIATNECCNTHDEESEEEEEVL